MALKITGLFGLGITIQFGLKAVMGLKRKMKITQKVFSNRIPNNPLLDHLMRSGMLFVHWSRNFNGPDGEGTSWSNFVREAIEIHLIDISFSTWFVNENNT